MSNLNNGGLTRVLNYIKTWVNGLLSAKLDRIDHGYTYITGNGTYSWCKLATMTIKSAYINNPITFEVDGRGRLKSTIQIVFASSSEIDPALSSFTSDVDMNFYIKKVATSTWELYGNYSETWGKFTLYRVTNSLDSGVVVIDTTPSNLSSAPSGTTRVSSNDLYVGSYRVYVG